MSKSKSQKSRGEKSKNTKNAFKIKEPQGEVLKKENIVLQENYPIFCFKHLSDVSIKDYKKGPLRGDFFPEFLIRLKKISELGWEGIRHSHKHSFGMEKISKDIIIPDLPSCVTPDVKHLHVFRATGKNLPFVGLQEEKIFRVFFIETKFGDIYKHS